MYNFYVDPKSDEYKSVLWKQFGYRQKSLYLYGNKKWSTLIYIIVPFAFLLAYYSSKNLNNLVLFSISLGLVVLKVIVFFIDRNKLKNIIKATKNTPICSIDFNESRIEFKDENMNYAYQWSYFTEYDEIEGDIYLYTKEKLDPPIFLALSLVETSEPIKHLIYAKINKKIL